MCKVIHIYPADRGERNLPVIDPMTIGTVARLGGQIHFVCRAYVSTEFEHMAGPHSVYWLKISTDGNILEAKDIPGITVHETTKST